ncbi:TNT domain-containing protein [Kibdelosporangium persicum]
MPPLSALEDTDEREPVSVPTSAPSAPDSANATAMMPAPNRGGGGNNAMTETRPQDWPIQPLYGEPPLTLFRGKRMVELHPGTEIDRFGEGDGNLTYAVGTPFPLRSLVPEWVNREYHVYRVQQSFEALTGVAIPWFEQPGGGTAFLLPHAVEDLIEDGYLVEIPGREPPPLT